MGIFHFEENISCFYLMFCRRGKSMGMHRNSRRIFDNKKRWQMFGRWISGQNSVGSWLRRWYIGHTCFAKWCHRTFSGLCNVFSYLFLELINSKIISETNTFFSIEQSGASTHHHTERACKYKVSVAVEATMSILLRRLVKIFRENNQRGEIWFHFNVGNNLQYPEL